MLRCIESNYYHLWLDWMISVRMRKFKAWLPLFSKISSERIGDDPYFGIFGQIFLQMDEDTHPHQDKSGWPVPGKPGAQIFWFRKIIDCLGPWTHFWLIVFTVAKVKFFIKLVLFLQWLYVLTTLYSKSNILFSHFWNLGCCKFL